MLERTSDTELARRIMREIKWDSRIDWASVSIAVKDAVVTLTGTVPNFGQKIAAQYAAYRVLGVVQVVNEIQVRPVARVARTDAEIATAVRAALEWEVLVPHESIQSTVSQGWVTLEGEVDYWGERNDAERTIRRLAGVVGIINKIQIRKRPIAPKEVHVDIRPPV